ncbi:hypothetical protein J7I91_15215 [Pseudomonas sp. ISL-84]|nr:hypothetical protein [Pseudomonas sp. ISL-84]
MKTAYSTLVVLYTFRMFGMSMVMMPVMTNGLNQLPARNNPHGTAMNNTLQQVSGAIGSALLITVMNNRTKEKAEELAADAMANMSASAALPSAQSATDMQQKIMNEAMLHGINFTFFISAFIAVIALILAFFIKRVKPNHEDRAVEEGVDKPIDTVKD